MSRLRPRLPTLSDFPPSLHDSITITPPPAIRPTATTSTTNPTLPPPATSLLILLHGLGDTHIPFSTLGTSLSLPDTACISLRAPTPVPELLTGSSTPSFHWADDIEFDGATGAIDGCGAGFRVAYGLLWTVLRVLVDGEGRGGESMGESLGWNRRDVHFLGYGQGATACLAILSNENTSSLPPTTTAPVEWGGIISIGGVLPPLGTPLTNTSITSNPSCPLKTPLLLCGGTRDTVVTPGEITRVRAVYADVEVVRWRRMGDGMPTCREEMMALMRFWGRRLRSWRGGGDVEGVVEVVHVEGRVDY